MRDDRGDPVGAFGVVAGVVLGVCLVPDDGRVHAAKDTRPRVSMGSSRRERVAAPIAS